MRWQAKKFPPHVSPASPTIATCSIIGGAGYGAIALIQRFRADLQMTEPYGARTPGWLDRAVIAATSRLPDKESEQSLWPKLLVIEDARNSWRDDLFSALAERGYTVAARTRLNVMMRRPAR